MELQAGELKSCNSRKNIVKAFLIAPLAPCMILPFPPIIFFGLPISYGSMLFIGLPLFLLFQYFYKINFLTIIFGGVFSGGLSYILLEEFLQLYNNDFMSSDWIGLTFMFSFFGLISSIAFWFIGFRKRKNVNK